MLTSSFSTCCLSIVQTTLYEERASLTQAYHIEYIFSYFVTSVAEFLLLVPITYLILDHASYQAYAMKMLKFVTSTTLLAILGASTASIVGYTLFNVTAFTHLTNTDGYYTIALIANVTYTSLCTALTLELLVLARIVLVRSLERLVGTLSFPSVSTSLILTTEVAHLLDHSYNTSLPTQSFRAHRRGLIVSFHLCR